MDSYVVGLDGGATSSRAVALGMDGTRVGSGTSGGANPNAHPPAVAAGNVAEALGKALAEVDAGQVRGCVLGLAGASKLTDPAVAAEFRTAWEAIGLRCPVRVVTDSEAAFAAATDAPDGTALVAGTGSVAARIVGHRLVTTIGGFGWLLGDEGSAFWLGREAVRAALRAMQGVEPVGELVRTVIADALHAGEPAPDERRATFAALITAANGAAPIDLARFAPLVSRAALAGDPVASRILDATTDLLTEIALGAREPGETTPVVLIGALIGPGGPLTERLRATMAHRCGGEVLLAGEQTAGAAGAAWLAAVDVLGEHAPRPA